MKTPTLELLLTSPHAFGLTTATPLQRALCRVIDGRPLLELATDPSVVEAFGADVVAAYVANPHKSKEVIILSAVRCAKSMICAAAAFRMARTCDLRWVKRNEPMPRVSILSVDKDKAQATFDHLAGAIRANPWMRDMTHKPPTMDSTLIRHESGRLVEIKIVAGAKAGGAVISRWCAGCICDEAPRMEGGDYVVNLVDVRNGVLPRLLPGAQVLYPGSPSAPDGPIYELVQEHWQKPSEVMVAWAPGWLMNPVLWTQEACEALKRTNPDAYVTDCAAKFASAGEDLFTELELKEALLPVESVPFCERNMYVASIDPATRGNAWTLTIATREGNTITVAHAQEWIGSKLEPLRPAVVLADIAAVCQRYGIRTVVSDQWSADALADIARVYGLGLEQVSLTTEEKALSYLAFKTRLGDRTIRLCNVPALFGDLKRVKRKPTQSGGVQFILPLTKDGRHCDYVPAAMLCMHQWLRDQKPEPLVGEELERKKADDLRKAVMKKSKDRAKAWS